jgi:hypothetical protein
MPSPPATHRNRSGGGQDASAARHSVAQRPPSRGGDASSAGRQTPRQRGAPQGGVEAQPVSRAGQGKLSLQDLQVPFLNVQMFSNA